MRLHFWASNSLKSPYVNTTIPIHMTPSNSWARKLLVGLQSLFNIQHFRVPFWFSWAAPKNPRQPPHNFRMSVPKCRHSRPSMIFFNTVLLLFMEVWIICLCLFSNSPEYSSASQVPDPAHVYLQLDGQSSKVLGVGSVRAPCWAARFYMLNSGFSSTVGELWVRWSWREWNT